MRIFLLFFFSIFFFTSCGLRYTPQQTPGETQIIRRSIIEKTLKDEFETQHKRYEPIAFASPVKIKPASYQKLDSLFAKKYELERYGMKVGIDLEEEIRIQQIVCQNDTNAVLTMERHIFTLEGDSLGEILSGDFYFNQQNQLHDLKFTESYHIDKNYINYYQTYIFEEPFLGGTYLTSEESDFYRQYKSELERRTNRDEFMNLTLQLMQIAYYKRSLRVETLLKELTRKNVHNDRANYNDEVFVRIEQVAEEGELKSYEVEYQSVIKNSEGVYTKRYQLTFDPYLLVVALKEIPIK